MTDSIDAAYSKKGDRWSAKELDCQFRFHSKRRDSCSNDKREPASLSSARRPLGRFVHAMVTSVPPDACSNVITIVISPKKAGLVVSKLTV